ncbi:hypothetical protein DCAR_0728784 [Daucus carota subsp. sativus]|uniref:Uncharacterized protein n=1 Tax=Daucus carota subsp. sativus TaxID=79200 RepID=A0AAF0XLM9_DAUCS|nr:hypothetical protein DCAR_0728784 [Daucus carota subsp. sativus]
MDNQSFMNVHAEVISLIFSYLILDASDFSSFAKLLMIWERERPSAQIKFVLEKLDWDCLYRFHNHPMEVTRDQFHGFVGYSVGHNVVQSLFFNSSQKLFLMEDVQLNLGILSSLASTHLPSSFTFLFFKSIYIRSDIDSTAREIFGIVNTVHLRGKVEELMDLLQSMYEHLFEMDYLLPQLNVCPKARDLNPQLKIDGFPNEECLWNSLCSNTVKGTYREPGEMFGKPLNLSHMWNSTCERCTLQLILYKILLVLVKN